MKKILYILTAVLLCTACNRDEDSIFDQTAAERLEAERQKDVNYLTSVETWEMRYFPNPTAAGYAFLCHFDTDGTVTVGAKNSISTNDIYKTESSLWAIDFTQSVTLSFKSYNTIFSVFADPSSDGIGYNGDYEFIILESSPDAFLLKGKKHSAYISMAKIEDGTDWEDYFNKIDAFNDLTFFGNDGLEFMFVNRDTVIPMTYEDGQFTWTDDNDELDVIRYIMGENTNEEKVQSLSFIVTPTGMHVYPYERKLINNPAFDLVISSDTSKLISTVDENIYFTTNFTAADMFAHKFSQDARWVYQKNNGNDPETDAAFDELREQAKEKGALINRVSYSRLQSVSGDRKSTSYILLVEYTVDGKYHEGYLNLTMTNKDNLLTFKYKNADASILPLLNRLGGTTQGAKLFTDIFCDTFTPSSFTGSKLNMIELLLTSSTKDGKYIHVLADTKSR